MIYKRDYDDFMKKVNRMMRQLNAVKDNYGAYLLDTDCGKMRIKVDDFKPKMKMLWVCTKVENPGLALQRFNRPEVFDYMTQRLDTFNGKYNAFNTDLSILYHWLYEYITSCLSDEKRIDY